MEVELRPWMREDSQGLAPRGLPENVLKPEHTTAVSLLDRLLHHATTVATNGTQTVLA